MERPECPLDLGALPALASPLVRLLLYDSAPE